MKEVVITRERPIAGQLKSFLDALSNQMSQSDYSTISNCIRSKKALEDDDELCVAECLNAKKWAKKVQIPYKGNDGKLKFHEQESVDPDIKELTLMEYQADLKEKKKMWCCSPRSGVANHSISQFE